MTWTVAESLRSVEGAALALCAGAVPLALLTARAGGSFGRLRRLHADDAGASYSLGYLMALPMYLWVLSLVIQCGLIILVKSGTMYAAYAAARSAIVWRTAEPAGLREERVRQAAEGAIMPFSSSLALTSLVGADPVALAEHYLAVRTYLGSAYPDDGPSVGYFQRKLAYAARATTLTWTAAEDKPGGKVSVELEHQMALHLPGIGRLLGNPPPWPDSKYYVYPVRSHCTLPSEAALGGNNGQLTIPYRSSR